MGSAPSAVAGGARLERRTQQFIDALAEAGGPPLYELSPKDARKVLCDAQKVTVKVPNTEFEDHSIPGGPDGSVSVRVFRPRGAKGLLPAVVYLHGGGWILGDKDTHDRLARELAAGGNVAIVFVNYTPSPEAHFPVALEQSLTVARWVSERGLDANLDGSNLVVAGDSVGGNMATALTMMAQERGGPDIAYQMLFYPVTDASFDTPSYHEFADGPWLTGEAMRWFWDAYLPDESQRTQPLASPLRASREQLSRMPPTLLITDENDVLRDEGEAYAHRLMKAGVQVTATRYLGTIHDFMLLNAITDTPAPRAAIAQATLVLRQCFGRE